MQIAAEWMKTQLDAYADVEGFEPRFFNCDTFNEMTPPTADAAYLAASSRAVVAGLRATLPDAIWIMQGWLFTDDVFWNETTVEAYLGGVKPDDAMIVQVLLFFLPSFLLSFLPSFLPLTSFLPCFLPSFLPYFRPGAGL